MNDPRIPRYNIKPVCDKGCYNDRELKIKVIKNENNTGNWCKSEDVKLLEDKLEYYLNLVELMGMS